MDGQEMSVKLLVVDDEPDLELLIKQKFRRQIRDGLFQVFFARNGVEALQVLNQETGIDLVLTDINMPDMDGLTLLLRLSEMDVLLKAVIVSAYGDMDNIRVAMNRGAADFLVKPIDFADLEITIDKTLKQLEVLRKAMREHEQLAAIQHDLSVAYEIQQSMLPREFPPFPDREEFEIYARMVPAKDVGGDFYDFYLIDDDHLGIVIGDVSGKGIPAALFMAMSRTLLKSLALTGVSPGECLERVNQLVCMENPQSMFVTVFYGVLDLRSGVLEYANGGHNLPYRLRVGGAVETLEKATGMALGVIRGVRYNPKTITLERGEGVFLYTDGVTEAFNAAGELFSPPRLQACLEAAAGQDTRALTDTVFAAVNEYARGVPQADDITTLAVRFH